ncbi:MAG: L-seryl-tRNA(Sec) selenium transferase, partial [Myxococcales bacterium]|nr:L-seryl-tRNA(Sec) selenium transferase [Myxococcales bacterium]
MSALRGLPRVDHVLAGEALRAHAALPSLRRWAAREAISRLRLELRSGARPPDAIPSADVLAADIARELDALLAPGPRPVINATGVLLHTNLGRAPLAPAAIEAMVAAAGVCDLEIDDLGRRGSRLARVRPLLAALTGAEDALVVNNGAAALLLACTALGTPGGVALSRGQLVEIGDRFRVAEMAAAAGARLWEVGSTNRTHEGDYTRLFDVPEGAPRPSALLWVHRSNFTQAGFVAEVPLPALASLARARGLPLLADLGSGSLGPPIPDDEPTIQAYLEAGAGLVTCSGDKLLGGPQAGILAGDAALIARCKAHPLARALRLDKTSLAALHATLAAHARGEALPLHAMITCPIEHLKARAAAVVAALTGLNRQVKIDASAATL